ncbi:nitrogen regulation protein NR(II) [candidate division KSB1 bacterium]
MNSENYFKAAYDGITDIIMIMDKDLRIIFGNKALKDFFSVDDNEIAGKKCHEALHQKEDYCADCPAVRTKKTKQVTITEKLINGEILKYWTYPVFNGGNELESIVSYGRNITNQKRIEQQLIQSEKLTGIGRLAAGVAHELNNPLSSILGFSGLMLESVDEDNPLYEFLTDIIESANQSKKIVTGLLEYSRQSVSITDSHNIIKVIDKVVSLVKHTLKLKEINVIVDNEEDLPKVKVDMQKTIQAFLNIITNAIDVMADGGTLFIKTEKESDKHISVSFRDTGIGIPEENLNKIFDPFFTTKEVGMGTGLGLSICLGIIEHQNGKIDVESEPGKGTTFKISLPIDY